MLIDETAAVGLNMGLGGGIFGGQGYTTFSPETVNDAHPRGPRAGDPRAHRPRQEPPERGAVDASPTSRSPTPRAPRSTSSRCSTLAREARPHPPGRLRQRDARPARQVPGLPVRRRADAQPLLRLVRRHRRPGGGRAGLGGGAARLGERRQADHHHRVRRRHLSRPALARRRSRGARSTRSTTWT